MRIFKDTSLLDIFVEMGVSLAQADVTKLLVVKPGNEKAQWTAEVSGVSQLKYEVQEGDLNKVGTYQVQGYFEVGGLKTFGEITSFEVHKNIE